MGRRSPELRRGWLRTAFLALVMGLPGWFVFEPTSDYRCGDCGSQRRDSQMRMGPSRDCSIPLSPKRQELEETGAARGLLGPGHAHRWTFAQGGDDYRFIRWGAI